MRVTYYGRELYHAEARERANHDYIARVQTPNGYRYFYDENELAAYYNGQEQNQSAQSSNQKAFDPHDITKHYTNDGTQKAIDSKAFNSGISKAHDAAASANKRIKEAPGKIANTAKGYANSVASEIKKQQNAKLKQDSKSAKLRKHEDLTRQRDFNNKINSATKAAKSTAKKAKDATYSNDGSQYAIDPAALNKGVSAARKGVSNLKSAFGKAAKAVGKAVYSNDGSQYAISPSSLKKAETASRSANQKAQSAAKSGGSSLKSAFGKAAKAVGKAVYSNDGSQTAIGAFKGSAKKKKKKQ